MLTNDRHRSSAWIYWEIRTFLNYHDKDWTKVIPVYIDPIKYDPEELNSAIGLEKHFSGIIQPWDQYKNDGYDWEQDRQYFYDRAASDIACSIFNLEDKEAFWSIKKKAKEAVDNEKKKNRIQKWFLATLVFLAVVMAGVAWGYYRYSKSKNQVAEARIALEEGNRGLAMNLARVAHQSWRWNYEANEVMWAASDSTRAYMTFDSPISFDKNDSLFAYVEKNKYAVIMEASSLQELDRFDTGMSERVILSPDGWRVAVLDRQHQIRVFNRLSREWEEDYPTTGSNILWNKTGDICLVDYRIRTQSGAYYLGIGYHEGVSSVSYSKVSFIGSDSLLVVLPVDGSDNNKVLPELYAYDFRKKEDSDWFIPSRIFRFEEDIVSYDIMPHGNRMVYCTKDSVFTYQILFDNQKFELEKLYSAPTPVPLRSIRYDNNRTTALAIDTSGTAYQYYPSGNLYEAYTRVNTKSTPVCLSNNDHVLYYLGNNKGINLTDSYDSGYYLPALSEGAKLSGMKHRNVLSIQVEEKAWPSSVYKSFLYVDGDGRIQRPGGNPVAVLSSQYVVDSSLDLFVTKNENGDIISRSSSICLFNPTSGEHIMHLSQPEDKEFSYVGFHEYYLSEKNLAVWCTKDGCNMLRLYDLEEKTITREISLKHTPWFINWLEDGSVVYADSSILFQVVPHSSAPPKIITESLESYSDANQSKNRIVFYIRSPKKNRSEEYWFSSNDQLMRPTNDGLVTPSGNYIIHRSYSDKKIVVMDSKSLDTLYIHQSDLGYFEALSSDGQSYVFSEGKEKLTCIELQSGMIRWTAPIWEPLSHAVGKNVIAVQSTSLYVLSLKTGAILCEFNSSLKEEQLAISPDDKWLIAGDRLYSITSGHFMGSGIETGYSAVENDYIIYNRKLMKLPHEKELFD